MNSVASGLEVFTQAQSATGNMLASISENRSILDALASYTSPPATATSGGDQAITTSTSTTSTDTTTSVVESYSGAEADAYAAAAASQSSTAGLSEEAKGFIRDELLAEQRQRTKELVDAAWMSLE